MSPASKSFYIFSKILTKLIHTLYHYVEPASRVDLRDRPPLYF